MYICPVQLLLITKIYIMKLQERYNRAFENFKQDYAYTMGGTQTIILPNGKSKNFDDREYYQGRGTKYNKNIKHDIKGDIIVSRKQYAEFMKMVKAGEKRRLELKKERIKEESDRKDCLNRGVYNIINRGDDSFIDLSRDEYENNTFDAERLAKTLDISIADCKLLFSQGKTYVFAKNKNGQTVNLYHADLSCNNLSIVFDIDNGETHEKFMKDRENWVNAPFAGLVGQTENTNHFVC